MNQPPQGTTPSRRRRNRDQLIRVQRYWDKPPGMLRKQLAKSLPPGPVDLGTIDLDPPPEWRRRVEVHGELTMKHQVMLGHDTIDHHPSHRQSSFRQIQRSSQSTRMGKESLHPKRLSTNPR